MHRIPYAIVGGGISGLAAAWELHRQGERFLLFEGADRLGGLIRTDIVGGFTLDAGPDSLLTEKPAAIELCRELGLADDLIPTLPPRRAYVVRRGRLHPLPAGSPFGIPTSLAALARSRYLSWPGRLRMALDLVQPPRNLEAGADESVGAFFRRRFGREAADVLGESLLAGIHAGDADRLSMGTLFPRLVDAERSAGSVIRALRPVAAARAKGQGDGLFRSFADGLETLPRRLEAALPETSIRRRRSVAAITPSTANGGRYVLRIAGGAPDVTADQVICALPAGATARVAAGVSEPIASLCRSIRTTSTAVVALAFPRQAVTHPLDGSGFVVPPSEAGLSILAATWISSKWPRRAPEGRVLMRGFVGGARAQDLPDRGEDALIDAVHGDLARLLGISGAPELARVYRWPDANPQLEVGHRGRIAAIDRHLQRLPGLRIIGAAFRGVGIPDCIAAGRATAGAAIADHRAAVRGRSVVEPT